MIGIGVFSGLDRIPHGQVPREQYSELIKNMDKNKVSHCCVSGSDSHVYQTENNFLCHINESSPGWTEELSHWHSGLKLYDNVNDVYGVSADKQCERGSVSCVTGFSSQNLVYDYKKEMGV